MKTWISIKVAVGLVSLVFAPLSDALDTAHLVPVEPDFGVSQPLGKLFTETYEQSLFTKKNWLIRYYRADTPVNVTIAFSIYLKHQAFWVNVSHATPEMDPLIRDAAENDSFDVSSVLKQVDLKSFDFPISKSTATALIKVWRNLSSEVKPDPSLRNRVFTDGPLVILFAKGESNQVVSGRVPPSAEQDVKSTTARTQPEPIQELLDVELSKQKAKPNHGEKPLVHQVEARAGNDYFVLFSWKIARGEYDFALVPIELEKAFLADFRPSRYGVGGFARLKAIMAQLPSKALIVWEEANDVGLELPPAQNIDDVVSFARMKNIRVELNPTLYE